jgi:hypothetical protein
MNAASMLFQRNAAELILIMNGRRDRDAVHVVSQGLQRAAVAPGTGSAVR